MMSKWIWNKRRCKCKRYPLESIIQKQIESFARKHQRMPRGKVQCKYEHSLAQHVVNEKRRGLSIPQWIASMEAKYTNMIHTIGQCEAVYAFVREHIKWTRNHVKARQSKSSRLKLNHGWTLEKRILPGRQSMSGC